MRFGTPGRSRTDSERTRERNNRRRTQAIRNPSRWASEDLTDTDPIKLKWSGSVDDQQTIRFFFYLFTLRMRACVHREVEDRDVETEPGGYVWGRGPPGGSCVFSDIPFSKILRPRGFGLK